MVVSIPPHSAELYSIANRGSTTATLYTQDPIKCASCLDRGYIDQYVGGMACKGEIAGKGLNLLIWLP